MVTEPSENSTRTPVSTGRDSSRDAARDTWATVWANASRSTVNGVPSASGRCGKSSAPWACSVYSLWPQEIFTGPEPSGCSMVTSAGGQRLDDVEQEPAGQHHGAGLVHPGGDRDAQRELHVGGRELERDSARSRIPERIWTVERCETPRAAIARGGGEVSLLTNDLHVLRSSRLFYWCSF